MPVIFSIDISITNCRSTGSRRGLVAVGMAVGICPLLRNNMFGSMKSRMASNSNIFAISSSNDRYSVYTINFNSGLVVAINDPAMSTESSWTDDTDQIRCAWLDMN
ncbi:hypothetical protein KCU98_g148, partial [Aureobasidium melanogenum]